MILRFSILLMLLSTTLTAQLVINEAPEKWSVPEKVLLISKDIHPTTHSPSLTADQKLIVVYHFSDTATGGFYYATRTDTGWSQLRPVPYYVERGLANGPCVTYDGKRLFFRDYGTGYGSWDLYYADWDSALGTWGAPKNMGPSINSERGEWACMTPDGKYLLRTLWGGLPTYSQWSDSLNDWMPWKDLDYMRMLEVLARGWMLPNKRKIYYDTFQTLEARRDIYVHYFDTISGRWGHVMSLNFCRLMDTSSPNLTDDQKIQEGPWLSPDGRTMYFVSLHDGYSNVYKTVMLIDENGNPVDYAEDEAAPLIPSSPAILQNYPNPFNPSTVITYELGARDEVRLQIVNLLGQVMKTYDEGTKPPGIYEVMWDGKTADGATAASGIYFCRLLTSVSAATTRMILLR